MLSNYRRVKHTYLNSNDALKTKNMPENSTRLRMISERDNYTCQYCGAPSQSVDHVVPKSKGGPCTWNNLVACCLVRAPHLVQNSGLLLIRCCLAPLAVVQPEERE